ncbi:TPA: hypothetical protein DDW35_03890 [Candidatus Sumerlaeota bacterium]|jgi:hypothetical protein|nr:hypothetical protein [Candidatus Sumerlaeota bacterium]
MPSRKTLYPLLLIAIALVAYCNTPFGPYCYDDTFMIQDVGAIESWAGVSKLFTHDFGPTFGDLRYRPGTQLTYFIDAMIFHKSSFCSRCINIVLHALVGLSLFAFWKRIFRSLGEKAPPLAFAAAAIFLCHPMTTEVVNCPGFRREELSLLAILWSILFLQSALEHRSLKNALAAALIWIAGLFTKETTFMIVGLAPMLFLFMNRQAEQLPLSTTLRTMLRPTRFRVTVLSVLVVMFALYLCTYCHLSYDLSGDASKYRRTTVVAGQDVPDANGKISPWPGGQGPVLGFLNFTRTTVTFAQLWTLPIGFSINHYFVPSRTLGDHRLWLSSAGFAIFLIASLLLYWRSSPVGVGGLWMCITFLPIAEIIPAPEILVERYLYHAHVGAALIIGALLLHWNPMLADYVPEKRATLRKFIQHNFFALALLIYIPLTLWRNNDWMNEIDLNIAAYKQWNNTEGDFRTATLYIQTGKVQKALPYWERVAREDTGDHGQRAKELLQKVKQQEKPR